MNRVVTVVVIIIVIVSGVVLLRASHAATPFATAEPEEGTITCAARLSDSTASGGAAIGFKACASSSDASSPLSLDRSGKTIPNTNYPIPTGAIFISITGNDNNPGTEAAPVKSLGKAIAAVPSGGTIVLRGGVYHDAYDGGAPTYAYKYVTKPVTFQAFPHEQVWLDGTETQAASNWTSDGAGHWSMAWSTPQFCNGHYYDYKFDNQPKDNSGACSHTDMNSPPEYPVASDPQMAFIDDIQQTEVNSLNGVNANSFYYDWGARRIYIGVNPNGHTVDLAVHPNAMILGGGVSGSKILGIGVRRYATNETDRSALSQSAIYGSQTNMLVENSVFTENASEGLYIEPHGGTIRHVAMVRNGYGSGGSNGHSESSKDDNLLVENSLIADNNTEHFGIHCLQSCGQAGLKIAHMAGFTVRNNIITKNLNGSGFWCDNNCTKGIIVNNLVYDNDQDGIFYEVSSDGIIAGNMLINNRYGVGLASATTKVYNNTMINNRIGSIHVYDDDRWSGDLRGTTIGPDNYGIDIYNNVEYGGSLISMVADRGAKVGSNTGPNTYFTGLDYNSYYRSGGTAGNVIRWTDDSQVGYFTLAAFRNDHPSWESHSQDISSGGDPFFTNLAAGDYSIRSNSQAYHSGREIPADIAAAMKVSTGTGQSRGALTWPGKN